MRGTAAITTTTTGTTTSNLSYTTRRRRRRRRSTSTITRGFILLVVSILLLAATLRWVQAFGFFVLPSSSSRVVVRHYNPNFHSKMSVRYKLSSSPFQQTTRNRNPRLSTTTPSFMTNKKMTTSNTILPPPKQSLRQVLEVTSNTTTTTTTTNTTSNPWIVGHRGCLYHELENTREGFWKCAAMGCDAVELDVFLLKCGTLVVFHGGGTDDATPGLLEDHCLGSTTIDQPSILDYTYAQVLEELEFDPQGSVFACPLEIFQRTGVHKVQMPTLQQVLEDAKASGMHVKIELKGEATTTTTTPNNQNKGLVESVLALVEDTTLQMPASQISYSSFCHDYLRQLRRLRPNRQLVAIGALFTKEDLEKFPTTSALIQVALDCGATEIHLPYEECTTSRIDAIHQAGLKSMCWVKGPRGMEYDCTHVYGDVGGGNGDDDGDTPVVLESLELYQILMETGVQQFCINRPDILVDWRREQQQQGEEAMIVSSSASSSSSSFNTTTSSSTEGSVPGG